MAELTMRGTGSIDQVFGYLDQAVLGHASSCEPAGTYGCAIDDAQVILRVYQKYYFETTARRALAYCWLPATMLLRQSSSVRGRRRADRD